MHWQLTVVLICISLRVGDTEHLFIYLLAICDTLESVYSCLSLFNEVHVLIRLIFLLLSFKSSLCILDNTPLSDQSECKYCLHFWLVLFTWHCLLDSKCFNFNEVQLINYFFMVCAFCVVSRSHCHIQGQLGFLLYSRSFIILHFIFRFEICMELIFVKGVKFCI